MPRNCGYDGAAWVQVAAPLSVRFHVSTLETCRSVRAPKPAPGSSIGRATEPRNGSENRFLRQVRGELADFPEESPRVVGGQIETEPPGLSFEKHSIRQPDTGCHRGPPDSSDEHALLPVGHNEVRPRIEPAPRSVTNVESCR